MKEINPNQLSDIQNYKLLSGSVIPRPIAFVTSEDEKGNLKIDAETVSYTHLTLPTKA